MTHTARLGIDKQIPAIWQVGSGMNVSTEPTKSSVPKVTANPSLSFSGSRRVAEAGRQRVMKLGFSGIYPLPEAAPQRISEVLNNCFYHSRAFTFGGFPGVNLPPMINLIEEFQNPETPTGWHLF